MPALRSSVICGQAKAWTPNDSAPHCPTKVPRELAKSPTISRGSHDFCPIWKADGVPPNCHLVGWRAHRFSRINRIKRRIELEIPVRRTRGRRDSFNHGAAVTAGPLDSDSQLCSRVPDRDLEHLQLQNRYP